MNAEPERHTIEEWERIMVQRECEAGGHVPDTIFRTPERATAVGAVCRCGEVKWVPEEPAPKLDDKDAERRAYFERLQRPLNDAMARLRGFVSAGEFELCIPQADCDRLGIGKDGDRFMGMPIVRSGYISDQPVLRLTEGTGINRMIITIEEL